MTIMRHHLVKVTYETRTFIIDIAYTIVVSVICWLNLCNTTVRCFMSLYIVFTFTVNVLIINHRVFFPKYAKSLCLTLLQGCKIAFSIYKYY